MNAWEATDGAVHQFIVGQLRHVGKGRRLVYGKRFYDDGRIRNLKMPVSRFVPNHIRNAAGPAGDGAKANGAMTAPA